MEFADRFIAGVQAGQQLRMQKQAKEDEAEERSLRKMVHQFELRRLKLQEAVEPWLLKQQAAREQFEALQGTPQAELTPEMVEGGQLPVPSQSLAMATAAPPGQPSDQAGIANMLLRMKMQQTRPPLQVPELGLDIPGVTRRPQTREELIAAKPPEEFTLAPGARRFRGSTVVAEGQPTAAPRPVSLGQQYLDAVSRGDQTEAAKIRQAMQAGRAEPRPHELTPNAALAQTRSLRNDFIRETASARTVRTQYELMKSSLDAVKAGRAAAGSQGVLVTFQKILDPTSVVRESEYARSASGLSLLSRLEGKWMMIQKGGAGVPVRDLEDFVALAKSFVTNQEKFATQTKTQIESIADQYGLEKRLIVQDIGGVEEEEAPALKVGDIGMVRGQKVRITKTYPDGSYDYDVVK